MDIFTNIQSNDKRFFVDSFNFFSFIRHGYAPFLILDYQPTYCNQNQNEYSLFNF